MRYVRGSSLAVAWAVTLQFGLAAAAPPPAVDPAEATLRDADAHANDPAYLARVLADFEARLKAMKAPRAVDAYVHGWLLSHTGHALDAVAAYDRAFAADKTFVDAGYNAGVVLGDLHREDDAIARFEAVLKVDPKHVDAAYNAAQSYYNKKNFKRALELWSMARAVTPNDFEIVKKVLQAENALGDPKAGETREALIALRKASSDARVRGLKDFCFDQFDVGKARVMAYETFDVEGPGTKAPDLYYLYTFRVSDTKGKVRGTVNLESSAVIRERGVPYVLGADLATGHKTFNLTYTKLPGLAELRAAVTKLVKSELADVVGGK